MTSTAPIREALACSIFDAVKATRAMGRVMLTAVRDGVIHERIGAVDQITREDDHICLAGGGHHARIDLAVVTSTVADRSSRMRDRVLPRIEFLNGTGETQFSLIALDGLDRFEEGLAALDRGATLPEKPRPASSDSAPADLSDIDPGVLPLNAAKASGIPIGVHFSRPGLDQSWTGVIAEVKPIMGNFNIILPDFHLHLRGGVVARWQRSAEGSGQRLEAYGHDGAALGLVLTGPVAALG
jgi:putative heme degradation protein